MARRSRHPRSQRLDITRNDANVEALRARGFAFLARVVRRIRRLAISWWAPRAGKPRALGSRARTLICADTQKALLLPTRKDAQNATDRKNAKLTNAAQAQAHRGRVGQRLRSRRQRRWYRAETQAPIPSVSTVFPRRAPRKSHEIIEPAIFFAKVSSSSERIDARCPLFLLQ